MARNIPSGAKKKTMAQSSPAGLPSPPWSRTRALAPEQSAGPSDGPEGDEPAPVRRRAADRARCPSLPWEQSQGTPRSESRVSVIDEQPPRPAPPRGASEDEYQWHTYKVWPSGRPDAVEFIDVYKAFGRARILRGLNMGLPEGMVSMIIGPSGTGKSVCIKHMVGLLYPDDGDILVHGESVPNMPDDDLFEMRKKFGLLFQDGALFGSMNLFDNVAFPLRQHTEKGEDEVEDIVMRRLNEVGLGDAREKMPNELSGGMRKRAGFARALVLEPDIVLFDEPDSGLDPVRTALLGELILEIHRDMMEDAKARQKQHLPDLLRDHPRHHERAAGGRLHQRAVEGPDRRGGPGGGHAQLRESVHPPVPLRRVAGPADDGLKLVRTSAIPCIGADSLATHEGEARGARMIAARRPA